MITKILDEKCNVKAIVAVNKHNVIGDGKTLLWYKPDDLNYFKEKTINDVVIMGSNTFLSLPIRPLKNRLNIVLSSDKNKIKSSITHNNGDLVVVNSIDELKKLFIDGEIYNEVWIIGGAKIYEQLAPFCGELHLTKVLDDNTENGVKFPIEKYNTKTVIDEIFYDDKTIKTTIFKL